MYDGEYYKYFIMFGFFLENDIFFIWNIDGVFLFKSLKILMWFLFFVINELLFVICWNFENLLFVGFWIGFKKLEMLIFLDLFIEDF